MADARAAINVVAAHHDARKFLRDVILLIRPARGAAGKRPEDGVFLGVLENGAAGDETGLPPGRYNLYAAQVGGVWKGYAESNGQIVRQAIRASTTPGTPGAKPQFNERGWCIVAVSYAPPFLLFILCF